MTNNFLVTEKEVNEVFSFTFEEYKNPTDRLFVSKEINRFKYKCYLAYLKIKKRDFKRGYLMNDLIRLNLWKW